MSDKKSSLFPDVTQKEFEAITDRTIGPQKNPVEASGNATLDAALNDPKAGEALQAAVVSSAMAGGGMGFVAGAGTGVVLMGILWAVWPKKKNT